MVLKEIYLLDLLRYNLLIILMLSGNLNKSKNKEKGLGLVIFLIYVLLWSREN